MARHYAYPLEFSEHIHKEAKENNVSFSLVAGVILAESKFDKDAKSDRGALGLMQVMPETAYWIAEQRQDKHFKEEDLLDPKVNISYGSWYLSHLLEEFGGNPVLALAAYNAGRGNVSEWMEQYGWDKKFNDIDAIPFEETRIYVKRVEENRRHYESLY